MEWGVKLQIWGEGPLEEQKGPWGGAVRGRGPVSSLGVSRLRGVLGQSLSGTWAPVRNAPSQALPQSSHVRFCTLFKVVPRYSLCTVKFEKC